jgi:Lrp/AsnC family transcriptional regulator, leucine-responsive regulatory protein
VRVAARKGGRTQESCDHQAMTAAITLDAIDRRILQALQAQGRATYDELAKASATRSPMDAFAAAVQSWPEVVECAALTGDMDYLLRVLVRDMDHYSRFIMDCLLKHPAVQDCKTSFLLRRLKGTTALPI